MRKRKDSQSADLTHPVIYWFCWWAAWLVLKAYFRLRIRRLGEVPAHGPALFVGNHVSNLDPPLIAMVVRSHRLHFMAKKELWNVKPLGWLIERLGSIPVDRTATSDSEALRQTIKLLKEGQSLVLFPEGTRSPDGALQEFKPGAARLAAIVPGTVIVPLRLRGAFEAWGRGKRFPRPSRITVTMGKPFTLDDLGDLPKEKKSLYRALATEMFDRISSL